jgi:hypothetical protein
MELCTSPESRLDAYEEGIGPSHGFYTRVRARARLITAISSVGTQKLREDAKANHKVVCARAHHPTFLRVRLKRRGHLANEGKWDPRLKHPVEN